MEADTAEPDLRRTHQAPGATFPLLTLPTPWQRHRTYLLVLAAWLPATAQTQTQTQTHTHTQTQIKTQTQPQPARSDSILKQHFTLAQQAQAAGNFPEAARQFRIFIADALAELALASVNAGRYQQAAPLFDEALALAPNSPALKVRYAQAALAANDLTRTRTLSEGILKDYPNNPKAAARAHLLLGRALSRMNQEEAARKHFEAAVALEPSFEDGYALAIASLDLNDGEAATKIFAEMITGLGDTAQLHVEFGRAYLNSDFATKAAPEFERAIALDPKLPGAHYGLAVALLTAGGDDQQGNIQTQAQAALEAELKLSPNDASTHAQLGNLALQQHRPQDAERELKQAATLDPADPSAQFYLGQLYAQSGRKPEAIAAFRKSIALTRDPAFNRYQVQKVHYQLARLLLETGQQDEGRKEMQLSATLLKRSLGKDRDRLASELEGEKASPESASTLAVTQPDSPERASAVAAVDAYEKQLRPAIADSYNNLGAIAAQADHPLEALPAFERAYEWNPQLPGIDQNWGLAAFRAGRFAQAIAPLTRALRVEPQNAGTRAELAISLFKTEAFAPALETLKPIAPQVEATPQLAFVRAASLARTAAANSSDLAAAIRQLSTLEQADPKNPEIHQELALAYRKQHKETEARREQQLAQPLNPR